MSQSASQTEFLQQVTKWSPKECQDNLDDALPKIISQLEGSAYIEESIDILKIICQSFLPSVVAEELEDRVFSQICKLTCSFMDSSLNKIQLNVTGPLKDTTEEVKSLVMECLQWMMDIITCVETFVKITYMERSSVELTSVQSLPDCAVHVLKQAYGHCKSSTDLYGDLLEHIAEPLSALFKKAHALQMSFLNLLDKICVSGPQLEEHVQIISSVCSRLFEICGIVTGLDVKLVISLWKGIARLCSQHLGLLRDRFDVCPLVRFLSGEIQQGFRYLFQLCPGGDSESLSQGDEQAFSKSVKILGFQLKVLVALLRDFQNYLGTCEEDVLALLITLHKYLPPSLCATRLPEKHEGELRTQLLSATAPILGHLMANREFKTRLTTGQEERPPEDQLPLLLIQVMVLDALPRCETSVIDMWIQPVNHSSATPNKGLLAAIFKSVKLCEVEMRVPVMLPGVMVAGKPQRQVSLYEHTATHICGYIGACKAVHFPYLEATLVENLGQDNPLCSLMAMDCWCFVARYGTADLCRDHVQVLVKAYHQLMTTHGPAQRDIVFKLKLFLPRLIRFMSVEHQTALVKQYPPEKEPRLWAALTPNCLNSDLAKDVAGKLVSWGLSVLQRTEVKASQMFQACDLFADMLCQDSATADCMTPQQRASLLDNVCAAWHYIHSTLEDKRPLRAQLVGRLLPLTKHLLPTMETGDMLKVLVCVQSYLKAEDNEEVALATAKFLSGFAKLKIPPSFEQGQVLRRLPEVFHMVLTHHHPVVLFLAMTAFMEFASHTVHEGMIPACVQGDPVLQERVEKFVSKKPYQPMEEYNVVEFLKKQIKARDEARQQQAKEMGKTKKEGKNVGKSSPGHPAKRARVMAEPCAASASREKEHDMETGTSATAAASSAATTTSSTTSTYQTFLDSLTSVATDLELQCSRSAPPPKWFVEAARLAVTRINDCISPGNNWFDSLS